MQDQWQTERVQWEKREADLLLQVATVHAVAAQKTKDLETLKAVNAAKSRIPVFTVPTERTSISGGRAVLNLDVQDGRPDSVVDAPKKTEMVAMSLSPSGQRWSVEEEEDWHALNEITSAVHTGAASASKKGAAQSSEPPLSPSEASLNQRISWSNFGDGMVAAASVGGAAQVAPISSVGSGGEDEDDLPPMPDANPPSRPKKYTATEWV